MEEKLSNLIVSNSVYVSAARSINTYKNTTISDTYPYFYLKTHTPRTKTPSKPILITRASTSLSFMLPYFRPLPKAPIPQDTALFGKVSVSGVGVSTSNTECENTGVRQPFGTVVNVPSLIPNEKYVFATAAYAEDGSSAYGIGETSEEFITLLPISLGQVFSYLGDIAYKLQVYNIAKDAVEKFCSKVIIKNEIRCNLLDSRINPMLAYSLNKDYVNFLSIADVRHLANSLLILSKSSFHLRNERLEMMKAKGITPSLVRIEDQKSLLRVCSYLILGLDVASRSNDYYLLKLIITEIYNVLTNFFQTQTQSPLLLHALLKCCATLSIIPADYLDSPTRAIASCITYQVSIATIQLNEPKLLNTVIGNDLFVRRRKWLTRELMKLVYPKPAIEESKKKGDRKTEKKGEKKGKVEKKPAKKVVETQEELVEPKEQLVVEAYELEKEGEAVDEFLLSLGKFNDKIGLNVEKWKLLLADYVDILTDGEYSVNELGEKLSAVVEFWKSIAMDPYDALKNLIADGVDAGPRYLEFSCKCLRRILEMNGWKKEKDLLPQIDEVPLNEELKKSIEDSLETQSKELEEDILERAIKRLQILDKFWTENPKDNKDDLKKKVVAAMKAEPTTIIKPIDNAKVKTADQEIERLNNLKWMAELYYIKGTVLFEKWQQLYRKKPSRGNANYFEINQLDFERIKSLLEDDEARISKNEEGESDKLFGEMIFSQAKGCFYALQSKSPKVLHNLITQVWNFLLYTQASPAFHKKLNSWAHLVIISYTVLGILDLNKGAKQVRFKEQNKVECQILYANMIAYAVQCLLMVEKWISLADLCQRFNLMTKNEYASYLLPFTIYAQTVLHQRNIKNLKDKEAELQARTEAFEKWAATKKKKSRAAMITGEIPIEEQEYNKDRDRLQHEIIKLAVMQDFSAEDKANSEELLSLIKRDSSTAKEALTNCRKLLIDYAQKTCEIMADQRIKGKDNIEVKKLQKIHQMIYNKVLNSYKKTIEILRERQESFMLMQALHELGNIYYAEGKLKDAEINWSDSLDTVYQELYVLNKFGELMKKVPNLVAKFGMKPCLNSLILLAKYSLYLFHRLHKLAYGNDLSKLSQVVEMGLCVSFEPFKLTIPHPQQYNLFALYKCTELFPVYCFL